jgi:hypothetical protein
MTDFWLKKSETQKVVETIDSITRMYTDYFVSMSSELMGVEVSGSSKSKKETKKKNQEENKKQKETGLNPLHVITGIGETINQYNKAFDGLFKNIKTSFFLNYFNYTINIGNVLGEAKRNPLIPNYHVDILKNMYMNTSIDYIIDFLVKSSVEDFRLNDGSINDEIVDIILNNLTKLTKTSYRFLPDIYNDMLEKVIPGNFIASMLTFQDNRTEYEKVLDMLIHLTPLTINDLKSPIIDDPFLGVLSILAPRQKKEKTIVEALGEGIRSLDISGYSKVKAADILLNRASDTYEQQKKLASNFLESLVSSIPVSDKTEKEKTKAKKTMQKSEQAAQSKNNVEQTDQSTGKQKDVSNKEQTSKQKQPSKQEQSGKKGLDEVKLDDLVESPEEENILVNIASKILNGDWVDFDIIEKEIYKFLE